MTDDDLKYNIVKCLWVNVTQILYLTIKEYIVASDSMFVNKMKVSFYLIHIT